MRSIWTLYQITFTRHDKGVIKYPQHAYFLIYAPFKAFALFLHYRKFTQI